MIKKGRERLFVWIEWAENVRELGPSQLANRLRDQTQIAYSDAVCSLSGFVLEGTIRQGKMVSQYCDYNIWGLIKDDIRQKREEK